MGDILEFTLGNIINGKFYGLQKSYLHIKCSIVEKSEIFSPN